MRRVNIYEAKTKLSALLADVEEHHESFIICRNGRAVAELRPISKAVDPLRVDPRLSKIRFHEDPVKPLSKGDWPGSDLA